MDVGLQQVVHGGVDRTVARDRTHAREHRTDHADPVMPAAVAGTFMTRVVVTVVEDLQLDRVERDLEAPADRLDPQLAGHLARGRRQRAGTDGTGHGSTLRNGRTSTRA